MTQEQNNENTQKDKKDVSEDEVVYHQLSKPTVGKKHNWKQRGTMIVCDSCETPHGFYVNVEDILTGIDKNGMPIIGKKF